MQLVLRTLGKYYSMGESRRKRDRDIATIGCLIYKTPRDSYLVRPPCVAMQPIYVARDILPSIVPFPLLAHYSFCIKMQRVTEREKQRLPFLQVSAATLAYLSLYMGVCALLSGFV